MARRRKISLWPDRQGEEEAQPPGCPLTKMKTKKRGALNKKETKKRGAGGGPLRNKKIIIIKQRGTRWSQEKPRGARRSQGEPGGDRGSQEELGGAMKRQEQSSQEKPGAAGVRRSQVEV